MKKENSLKCLSIVTLLFSTFLFSQEKSDVNYLHYYRIINEAEYYYYNYDYQQAKPLFEKAFQLGPKPMEYDKRNFARTLSSLGDTLGAIKQLTNNIFAFGMEKDTFYYNDISLSTKLKLSSEAGRLREEQDSLRKTSIIYQMSEKYYKQDQHLRFYLQDTLPGKYRSDSLREKREIDSIWNIDRINMAQMDSIFQIHGFMAHPDDFMISPLTVGLFMLHVEPEYYIKNKDFLLEQVGKGQLSAERYALGLDKMIYLSNDLPVHYEMFANLMDSTLTAEEFFKRKNEFGMSPYFDFRSKKYTKPKPGMLPNTSRFYEVYRNEKYKYNCEDYNKN